MLNVPAVERVRYDRNFIKIAVCELRFPTLLELETKAPSGFQSKLRKAYPFYEPQVAEQGTEPEHRYLFRSKDKAWTVALKSSALALETSKYRDFEDFREKFSVVLESARTMIDSDFFTRVGLRYVNWVPMQDDAIDGWVRPELVSALTCGALGPTDKYFSLIQGKLSEGIYVFRQAIQRESEDAGPMQHAAYVLDTDYSREDVGFDQVLPQITSFNATNFNFFNWCLGDKARSLLGKGRPK